MEEWFCIYHGADAATMWRHTRMYRAVEAIQCEGVLKGAARYETQGSWLQ